MRLTVRDHELCSGPGNVRDQVVEHRERRRETGRVLGHEVPRGLGVGAAAPWTAPFPQ